MATQVVTVLSDIICIPFKTLLDVKADNLDLLQTNIRIAESFYWALACFYEEVSLA